MVDFTGEEGLPLFRPPPLGDVGGDAADPDNAIVVVERRHRRAGAPPDFAIRAVHAKFGLVGARASLPFGPGFGQPLPILGIEKGPDPLGRYLEVVGVDAKNAAMTLVPHALAACEIPVPRAHLPNGERQASTLLAFEQHASIRLQLCRSLCDARFELFVEPLKLPGFAVELGEDLDLGAEHLRDHRDRHVVHGAHGVAPQSVYVGEVDRRDEDDRGFPAAWMFADHGGKLEAVQIWHADIK